MITRIRPEAGDGRTGSAWLADLQAHLLKITAGETVIDLSAIRWVNLFEWTSAMASLRGRIGPTDCDITFDFAGAKLGTFSTAAFATHIGTVTELARGTKSVVKVTGAPAISTSARFHTTLLGLTLVSDVNSAFRFLDDRQISAWRELMQSRFPGSPLFEHELFWRLLCFELAMNVVEHARAFGYLAAHVVASAESDQSFDFAPAFQNQTSGPFLELCIADAGVGVVSTLAGTYAQRHQISGSQASARHVIEYAVHELGSSKDILDTWITDRHALARVLSVVEQYGGVLRIRSGEAECVFDVSSNHVVRATRRLGYEATSSVSLTRPITGTHIQILLPLQPRNQARRSAPLHDALPSTYAMEEKFPIGHYVPLTVYIDGGTLNDVSAFVSGCRAVARSLLGRPANEPVVFDLEESAWTPSHFDTLIGELENVIARRPTLVIGATEALASELRNRADVDETVALRAAAAGAWQRVLLRAIAGEPSLRHELRGTTVSGGRDGFVEVDVSHPFSEETLTQLRDAMRAIATEDYDPAFRFSARGGWSVELRNRRSAPRHAIAAPDVWHTTLVLDRAGRRTFAGPEPEAYRTALLSLLTDSRTPQQLAKENKLSVARLTAVLTRAQPLFSRDADKAGAWQCAWDDLTIAPQVHRSVVRNFYQVVQLTGAWLGRRLDRAPQTLDAAFYLPMDHEWRDGFLESAQIITRERYADEIGQRLVGSLRRRLGATPVHAFAAATTPALILAAALAHWWAAVDGDDDPLPVIDLGDYLFQGREDSVEVPDGVVLVQDVLSRGTLTKQLFDALHNRVVAVAAFVELEGRNSLARRDLEKQAGVVETLIKTPAPRVVDWDVRRPGARLVEMRTLRPVDADGILNEQRPASEGESERNFVAELTRHGDSAAGLIRTGHFVTGRRHHVVGVDIRLLKKHPIGAALCDWIVDVALGSTSEPAVVGVLMPLSSQIRTLWPQIRSRLALRGRRLPAWYLEETLQFQDRIMLVPPPAFRAQLEAAAREQRSVDLMVLDDAIITGRTLRKVLATISEVVAGLTQPALNSVRYFALLDRQPGAERSFTAALRSIGTQPFKTHFTAKYELVGPLPYGDYNCPACEQRHSLLQLSKSDVAVHSGALRTWCATEAEKLEPKSLEHGPPIGAPVRMRSAVTVFAAQPHSVFRYADHAVTRALELISRGVPVVYLLDTLAEDPGDLLGDPEYDRYRWALLHWCLRHWKWSALMTPEAKGRFRSLALREFDTGSMVVPLLLAETGLRGGTAIARYVFETALDVFAKLPDVGGFVDVPPAIFSKAVALEIGLLAFGASVSTAGYRSHADAERLAQDFEAALKSQIESDGDVLNRVGVQLLEHRLKVKEEMDRGAALESLAETMYRERSPDFTKRHSHDVLPKVLIELSNNPGNAQARHFAREILGLFLRSAEVIDAYTNAFSVGTGRRLLDDVRTLLEGISCAPDIIVRELAGAIKAQLMPGVDTFMMDFAPRFNAPVSTFITALRERAGAVELEIIQNVDPAVALMTDLLRLQGHLINIAVDPKVKHQMEGQPPRIVMAGQPRRESRATVVFEVTTFYRPFEETRASLESSPKYAHEVAELQQFGCAVEPPVPEADGWPRFRICVPVGFPVQLDVQGV